MPHTIRTENLVLRPAGLRGARAFWHEVRDWDVMRRTSAWPYPLSYAQCTFMMRKVWDEAQGAHVFFIVHDSVPTGSIGLHCDGEGSYWIGYMLGRQHWGRGFASEAVAGMLKFGFGPLRAEHIWAHVAVDNPGSIRVLRKQGFVQRPGYDWSFSRAHQADIRCLTFDLTRTEFRP